MIRCGSLAKMKGQTDVFELSSGLSLLAWKLVRRLYRAGASDGLIGRLYAKLRHGADYNRPSLMLTFLGKNVRHSFGESSGALVVAHPLLVAILKNRPGLIYQHGELAAPVESVVRGAEYVLVPTSEAAEPFLTGGYTSEQIITTGLCIEPALARQAADCFGSRIERINGQVPLTGAYFSSGAEPKSHVEKLVTCAGSAIASDGRAIVFAKRGGGFGKTAAEAFQSWQVDFETVTSADYIPAEPREAMIVNYDSRRELDIFTSKLFPFFDYFVAPSHERTNWALGLGLPMFVVGPAYGPFAPINLKILDEAGVAEQIMDNAALSFGKRLKDLRQHGNLSEMAQRGWEVREINGFEKVADFLLNYCQSKAL